MIEANDRTPWRPANDAEARSAMLDVGGLPCWHIAKDDFDRIQNAGHHGKKNDLLLAPFRWLLDTSPAAQLKCTSKVPRSVTVHVGTWFNRSTARYGDGPSRVYFAQFTSEADAKLYAEWHPGREWKS